MDKKTVEKMLNTASRDDLTNIITKLTKYSSKADQVILDWCKKNNTNCKDQAICLELQNLWVDAQKIISKFNVYGGGPDLDEEKAADALWKMDEIVKKQDIPWNIRIAILDEMLTEFFAGNSGFDDLLIDVATSFCKTKDEKRYLADVLKEGSNDYYRNYSAMIYKEIGDEKGFLETKLSNLRYGSDYVEVAKYYDGHGERQKAKDIIWKGLKESQGRLDELISYIAPVYIKEKNNDELQRLYKLVMKTKWDINICAIARYLFEYAKSCHDDINQKKMLFLLLDTCEKNEIEGWYQVCKQVLDEVEWQHERETILGKVKKKNMKFYLDICMESGESKTVLEYLQKQNHGYDYWDIDYDQYFSSRLLNKYPDEILALYWRDINNLLQFSNQKNYGIAADMLEKVKSSMIKIGREQEWKQQFLELKERHKRKKNFICLLNKL